jgi:hypothetical protein
MRRRGITGIIGEHKTTEQAKVLPESDVYFACSCCIVYVCTLITPRSLVPDESFCREQQPNLKTGTCGPEHKQPKANVASFLKCALLVPAPPDSESSAAERRARPGVTVVTRKARVDEARKDESAGLQAAAPIGKQTGQGLVGSPLLAGALSHGLKGRTMADGPVC